MNNQSKGRGRPKKVDIREVIKKHLPVDQILMEEEMPIYDNLIESYLQDFDEDDLSVNDIDDIVNLAMNRVMEFRLLKFNKEGIDGHLSVSNAVEKLRKNNEKIKESLSTRRRDRINPDEWKGYSIVDIAVEFDKKREEALRKKDRELKMEEEEMYEKKLKKFDGNKNDSDRFIKQAKE